MSIRELNKTTTFRTLAKAWKKTKGPLHWGGFWGSSKALATCCLSQESGVPFLVIVPDRMALDRALDDFKQFGGGAVPFPAREAKLATEANVLRERFHALDLIQRDGFEGVLVAPLAALLQPIPSQQDESASVFLEEGTTLDPETLLKTLTSAGFARVPAISEAGQVAMRGDIIDFFAPGLGEPLRVEFFDEEIESMRIFDLGSQRTRHVLKQVHVPLSREIEEVASAEQLLPLEEMPEKIRVFLWEPGLIEETAQRLRLQGGAWSAALARNDAAVAERNPLTLATLPGRDGTLDVLSVEEFCRGVADGLEVLAKRAKDGEKISICCSTEAEQSRVEHLLEEGGFDPQSIQLPVGGLTKGFRIPEARLTWLHHRELIPGHGQHRPKPRGKTHESDPVASATALKPGDIVVHAIHGLARFCGLDVGEPSKDAGAGAPAGEQDVLVLEFDGGSLLQVPAARVDLVERFIGAGGSTAPALDRLGSGSYKRRRLRVESAVEDLAASLLDVQARRASRSGTHFPVVPEQKEFDESFPWEDTPDQAQGAREIALDLADPKPMDRLVCGDVGYGKTEMAARALFAVVHHGWQAAVLVPTTVLAEQHTRTLRERFADWPIRIEQLSRIVSAKDQKNTLEGMASGRVDIVVGTHRILSQDVTFEKLGLVVIDEEQRFGVRAKNLLKRKRAEVDVLTLSATPIPRTLHMAMTGLRDITSLSTAPTGRQEITTEIRYGDEEGHIQTLLQAELARGGQAFFIHNRVKTLEHTAARLQRLMPNANIATGHGQMAPNDLEEAMLSFVRGDTDIFCSTTIVESGLDIANANTILIDDAHHYGLADLHQLRGRVGRSTRSGSCTLLIPRGQSLPEDARRRLKAVEELRYLGAGFQIAMRDLEIRGAGNLLGAEQSGHINAVGYETYRKLLAQSVARLKQQSSAGHPPRISGESSADISIGVAAALPPTYVSDDTSRLELLRSFDKLRQPRELKQLESMLKDRFGPPPAEVMALAQLFFLKHRLGHVGFERIQRIEDRLVCTVPNIKKTLRTLQKHNLDLRTISHRLLHWVLPNPQCTPQEVLQHLFEVASACPSPRKKRQSLAKPS